MAKKILGKSSLKVLGLGFEGLRGGQMGDGVGGHFHQRGTADTVSRELWQTTVWGMNGPSGEKAGVWNTVFLRGLVPC